MDKSQRNWLLIGMASAAMSLAAMSFIGYFLVLMLTSPNTEVYATSRTEPIEKIPGPEQVRRKAASNAAAIKQANIETRYTTIAPQWALFQTLYATHDFDEVERVLASQFHAIHDPWKATEYSWQIQTLSGIPNAQDPQPMLDVASRWTELHPKSHFAWLVRGGLLRSYAWYWRGSGWAESVTDEGWDKFQKALVEANTCLEKSHDLEPRDPESAYQMLWVYIGAGAPRDEFEKMFNCVTDLVPTHLNAHLAKQQYLLPKWDGSWPETDAFMRHCRDLAIKEKFPLLATVCFKGYDEMSYTRDGYKNIFERSDVADSLIEAFDALLESAPDRNLALADHARILYRTGHYEGALADFEQLGDTFYAASIWDSVVTYNRCRAFTYYRRAMRDPMQSGQRDLETAVELGVNSGEPYWYLAVDRFANQDLTTAETYLTRGIDMDPDYSPSWVTLAGIYQQQRRYDDLEKLVVSSKQYDIDQNTRNYLNNIAKKHR